MDEYGTNANSLFEAGKMKKEKKKLVAWLWFTTWESFQFDYCHRVERNQKSCSQKDVNRTMSGFDILYDVYISWIKSLYRQEWI